ncbi:hypothetical protein, partial [Acidithiobacillus ferrooxidans]|uniref:hypothetical protein n=1 Tax=Acidithiobacillus ferrooxidans TaxID=920 RepID=UPI001C066518
MTYDITILLLASHIKHGIQTTQGELPLKDKVTFSVCGVISPLLANVFLHYALDLWAHRWRQRHARG